MELVNNDLALMAVAVAKATEPCAIKYADWLIEKDFTDDTVVFTKSFKIDCIKLLEAK